MSFDKPNSLGINGKREGDKICLICGDMARGNNFGIISCMACAAFFRSSIQQCRNYCCRKDKKCRIDKRSRVGCRACRMERCLQLGMQKDMVRMAQTEHLPEPSADATSSHSLFQQSSDKDVMRVPQISIQNDINDNRMKQMKSMQFLMDVVGSAERIRESGTILPDSFFDHFQTLEQLISCNINLLNRANDFSTNPPVLWDKETFMARVQKDGLYAERPKHRVLDHFLIVEMAKRMPAFTQMGLEDQVNLIKYINVPMMTFINAYYSMRNNSDTIVIPNGHTIISAFLTVRYGGSDPRIFQMCKRLYCDIMEVYKNFDLTNEEFSLLLAVFYSHSSVPNLSSHATQILYQESISYSQLLLQHLQTRLGPLTGANRYMEALQLLNHAIQAANFYSKFKVYMDIFHLKNGSRDAAFPKALMPIYKQ